MEAKARVRSRIERAVGDHARRPADALLRRLKDERHPPGQLGALASQDFGYGQQDGGVTVMPAGVMG